MTTSNADLPEAIHAAVGVFANWPHSGLDDLIAGGVLQADISDRLTEAADRLTDLPTLDGIEVAPARATDPATSKAAARNISATNARGKIALAFYKNFALYGGEGLTAAEATRMAKLEHLAAPWKRVSELKQASIIRPTGDTRRGTRGQAQEVLVLTDHGKVECERLMPVEVMEITAPKAYGVDA